MINMTLDLEKESLSPLEWKNLPPTPNPQGVKDIIKLPGNQILHKQFMDGLYRK